MIKKLFSFFWDKSFLTFLLIGGGNFILTSVGMLLLYNKAGFGYWGSSAVMFFLCSILSFILNRKYSFQSKAPLLKSAFRFSVVIAVCYFVAFGLAEKLTPALLLALIPTAGAHLIEQIAMLFAQVIFTGFNYIGQRLWAFRPEAGDASPESRTGKE